jgi:hypothetical protein
MKIVRSKAQYNEICQVIIQALFYNFFYISK